MLRKQKPYWGWESSYFSFDVLCAVSVDECVPRLLELTAGRADVCDHHRTTVAAQRVFQQPRQLAVAIVNVARTVLVA